MLRFSFELDRRTTNKLGAHPLKLRVSRSRNEAFLVSLKIFLRPSEWDEAAQRVAITPTKRVDNIRIDTFRADIGALLLEIDQSGEDPPMAEVRRQVQVVLGQKQSKPTTLRAYMQEYANKIPAKGTRSGFLMTIKKVQEFDPTDRSFSQITAGWLRDFEMHYLNKGLKPNSLFMHTRNIRTIYNRAIDDGIAQLNDYPFRRFKIKQERTRKRALSVKQLRALWNYPCEDFQQEYRDIFMLVFFLGGINMIDLFKLTKTEEGRIDYIRSKTGVPVNLAVQPEAQEIIDRYRGTKHLLAVADRYKNHEDYTKRINRALQKIGIWKMVENNAEDPKHRKKNKKQIEAAFPGLTVYWARHTVATLMAELDTPKETIAKVLAHSDNSVTDIYIRFDQRKVDKAMRDVIDFVKSDAVDGTAYLTSKAQQQTKRRKPQQTDR